MSSWSTSTLGPWSTSPGRWSWERNFQEGLQVRAVPLLLGGLLALGCRRLQQGLTVPLVPARLQARLRQEIRARQATLQLRADLAALEAPAPPEDQAHP